MVTKLYTVEEAAELLRISPDKLYRLRKAGEIPHRKIGGAILFADEDIQTYLAACYRPAVTQ